MRAHLVCGRSRVRSSHPATFFRGDWPWNNFYGHSLPSADSRSYRRTNIGIKHDFSFINIRKVPREVLKTEGEARSFQHLPRDLANANEWQNHAWSLLLHKFKENTPNWENVCALYSSALPQFSYARTLFINILDSGRGQVLFLMMIWRLSTRFAWRPGECMNIIQ